MKIKDKVRNFFEVLAILDSGLNTGFISKNVTKKLGLRGPKLHLTMNLAGGQKKSEESELVNITVVHTNFRRKHSEARACLHNKQTMQSSKNSVKKDCK